MKWGICTADTEQIAGARTEQDEIVRVQFGAEQFVYGRSSAWSKMRERADVSGVEISEGEDEIDPEDLHVVVQKGRLFENEHPEVKVLLNKGRFLVVELPTEKAERIRCSDEPCFSIAPLSGKVEIFRQSALRAEAPVPWIEELVEQVSTDQFTSDVERLVAFETRHSFTSHYEQAANTVRDELELRGFTASLQEVSVGGRTTSNVVADRPGSLASERRLVIAMAHLDSVNLAGGEEAVAPGADDNASGSAGVLTLAGVFGGHDGEHDLRLILFGGEEQGLHGSIAYVENLSDEDRNRLIAAVNMDMIGSLNTASPTVLLEGAPVSEEIISLLSASAATYTSLEVQTSLEPYASDHVPFIRANLPAVLSIEGADGANDRIHSAGDTIEHLSPSLSQQILKMIVAGFAGWLGRASSE